MRGIVRDMGERLAIMRRLYVMRQPCRCDCF